MLFKFCQQDDLNLLIESVNGIIDIFSEDDHNEVLKDANFIKLFKPQLKTLRTKVQSEGANYEPEDCEHFEEVLDNLAEFIKYKEKMIK